jgi:excinuclease ABC subunit A
VARDRIIVRGARVHNLKNIDVEIPRDRFVVITGLSGSGKSSLAFDTIFAEGQRRYVESLSAYARQFLGQMDKPDVDYIEGLSPAISIDQKTTSRNPRSTVGTVTEIYDYLRLLYARIGRPHCHRCGRPISQQTVDQMVGQVLALPAGTRIQVLAPLVRGRKGEHESAFEELRRGGYVRVRVDGEVKELQPGMKLEKNKKHTIEAVIDRLVVKPEARRRLADSLETALKLTEGLALVSVAGGAPARPAESAGPMEPMEPAEPAATAAPAEASAEAPAEAPGGEIMFSERFACPECGVSMTELTPRMFSFNSPYGACPACHGLGANMEIDPDLVIPDRRKSLADGAIPIWSKSTSNYYPQLLESLANHYGFSLDTPVRDLEPRLVEVVLYGSGDERMQFTYHDSYGRHHVYSTRFEGVVRNLERRYRESTSEAVRLETEEYMSTKPCPQCQGLRLRPESLAVTVGERSIAVVTALTVAEALEFFQGLQLTAREELIARQVLKEIRERMGFMMNVGLDYLTLDRPTGTLAGGEAQRIRLATQIGSSLVGVLYILDEPSVGLHQRDNARLIATLKRLRDLGNTLIVVEHDEETIWSSDWVIDIGPGAGALGGRVIAAGTPEEIMECRDSLTGQYLSGRLEIPVPPARRESNGKALVVRGAAEHNLRGIDVRIPLGMFVCVTGVSGSGKSTLVDEIIHRRLAQELHGARAKPGEHAAMDGICHLEKVINVDQSPIGRTPRSNPATYTGCFDYIREVFSRTPEARARGYRPGRFSFNVRGGRCEACRGDGTIKIEMNFLPDVYVTCEVCKGKRYNSETLEAAYRGKSIADVLDMNVDEGLEFFKSLPRIRRKLETLHDVGLGYIRLGQPATTLSGGEAQRVKLATELSRRSDGRTLYILDEPTTGLHMADIHRLLDVLQRLVDAGDTVLVIEHNLDVIKSADWVIDLGPEGGAKGGEVVAEGTPEDLAAMPHTYTGQFLRKIFDRAAWKRSVRGEAG